MAGASLLTLIDDIATLLDDVSVMTKVAAKKTAGVLGDDLALNAQQVTGIAAERELPVVWRVAKGSAVNKVILVPAALLVNAISPVLVIGLLLMGGGFLCFEGFEKVMHKVLHHGDPVAKKKAKKPPKDPVAYENTRVKGAVRTDFILSAEIIVITLSTVVDAPFLQQVLVLIAISVLITVGVYGLVAGIVKLDDLGLHLVDTGEDGSGREKLGAFILRAAPLLMKGLGIVGTIAMFLVGGGIVEHNVPFVHDAVHHLELAVHDAGPFIEGLTVTLAQGLIGVIVGGLIVAVVTGINKVRGVEAH